MTAPQDALLVFQPSGRKGRFPIGTPVLDAARELGVYVESVCGGRGICGKCQVSVASGKFAKFGIESSEEGLSPKGFKEERYDDKRGLEPGMRLSCSATLQGDIVIDIPDAFRVAGQTIRKDANTVGMLRDPAIRLCYVELDQPDMHNPLGDGDRLCRAIEKQFDLENLRIQHHLKGELQKILRRGDWEVTAAVHLDGPQPEIIALYEGLSDEMSGIAVDIGSTTIAAHLTDLSTGEILASAGVANPQIRFGEDLMSRVSYVMMNERGQDDLNKAVIDAVNSLIGQLLDMSGRKRSHLLDCVFVANPVMHHLFLGWDPTEIGQAPFALVQSTPVHVAAYEIGLDLPKGTQTYLLPLIAGHVGADAAAVLLAERPQENETPTLIVDVGTNAEIALWNGTQLFAASSPTGPAFEGAETSCGQRAAPGAIERIRINRDDLSCRYKVIGTEQWSDEDGFGESVQTTGVTGICGSGIIEVIGEMRLAGILTDDGIIRAPETDTEKAVLVENGRTWSFVVREGTPRLVVTQNDVRAIQLAKAALYAGVKLLMDKADLHTLGEIKLAGAFGSYIDPAYAMLLGLVPDCDVDHVRAVGNAAGQGALRALLSRGERRSIEETAQTVTKIETALEPAFQQHFVDAMGIPNSADAFPLTRGHFAMDAFVSKATAPGDKPKRRGRRRGGR